MKTPWFVCSLLIFNAFDALAQGTGSRTTPSISQNASTPPQDTPYAITSRSANSRVWHRTTYELTPSGQWFPHVHSYTEMASGLCYDLNGQWVDSVEEIDATAQGAAQAVQGQHKVYFPYDIYNGVVEIVTPDGEQLQNRPLGISYFDGTNRVFIAQLTNSIGQMISSNRVIYTNAFTGIAADLICTYRRSGFESDVVFREQPYAPEVFGLSSENSRLELFTEFFNTPEPVQISSATTLSGLADTTLKFGAMTMIRGKAFAAIPASATTPVQSGQTSTGQSEIPVAKTWTQLQGSTFLIEAVPFDAIKPDLQTLPTPISTAATAPMNSILRKVSAARLLRPARMAQSATNNPRFAKAELNQRPGVVLDYNLVNSTYNGFTFQGDTTYLISGTVDLGGPVVVEGGTVIKYSAGSSIVLIVNPGTTFTCETRQYSPIVFTAVDDNSFGEQIGSGNPLGYYASPAIVFDDPSELITPFLKNIRILYAQTGLFCDGDQATIYDAQFVACQNAIWFGNNSLYLRNSLFANCPTNLELGNTSLDLQNVTFAASQCLNFDWGANVSVAATNCIFEDIESITNSDGPTDGSNNGFYNSPPFGANTATNQLYPFQTAFGGTHYLTNGTTFANASTINIDPVLFTNLQQRTVYPPIVYLNTNIATAMTFSPQASRDTNVEALGYHYDPLDFVFGGVQAGSNLTFTAGTAAGWNNGNAGFGINLANSMVANFEGAATTPDYWVRCNTVQEEDSSGGFGVGGVVGSDNQYNTNISISPVVFVNFTRCAALADCDNHFRDNGGYLVVQAKNSEFYSGNMGGYVISGYFTNCLWDRQEGGQVQGWPGDEWIMRNCTFHGGQLYMSRITDYANTLVSVRDCSFDGTGLTNLVDELSSNPTYTDYNFDAYTNVSNPFPLSSTNDVIMTNGFNWQTSRFGNYYLPTNSLLIRAGDVIADQVGLYHFTTQTNQIIEATNIVDIGYHYVATDNQGLPLDTNSNGIPDYIEDVNGNGQGLTVTLMSPTNNASFIEPATIPLQATVLDWRSIVTNVTLLHDGIQITAVPTAPFTYSWPVVAAGAYSLTATAYDAARSVANSPAVSVAVTNLCSN